MIIDCDRYIIDRSRVFVCFLVCLPVSSWPNVMGSSILHIELDWGAIFKHFFLYFQVEFQVCVEERGILKMWPVIQHCQTLRINYEIVGRFLKCINFKRKFGYFYISRVHRFFIELDGGATFFKLFLYLEVKFHLLPGFTMLSSIARLNVLTMKLLEGFSSTFNENLDIFCISPYSSISFPWFIGNVWPFFTC